jgi:hypothetical protein
MRSSEPRCCSVIKHAQFLNLVTAGDSANSSTADFNHVRAHSLLTSLSLNRLLLLPPVSLCAPSGPGLHTLAFYNAKAVAPGFWHSLAWLVEQLPDLGCVHLGKVGVRAHAGLPKKETEKKRPRLLSVGQCCL